MKKNVLTLAGISALCLSLTACSSVGSNTQEYISQVSTVLSHYDNSEALSKMEEDDANRLAAPENVSVDQENWTVTFDAVDTAAYYLATLTYSDGSSSEELASITIEDDGSSSYTGDFGIISVNGWTGQTEIKDTQYGTYTAKVVAVPGTDDTEHKKSRGGTAEFTKSGEVAEPAFEYFWNRFDQTLRVQISNLSDYATSENPESIAITLTNTADSSDTQTLTMESPDLSARVYEVEAEGLDSSATYAITAEATWSDTYVTNPEASVTVGEVALDADNNVISDGYGYLNNDVYMNMDYPALQTNFDTAAGGSAGSWFYFYYTDSSDPVWDESSSIYYTATPESAASDGALYSYTLSVGNADGHIKCWSVGGGREFESTVPGTLKIYADGTFTASIDYTYFDFDKMTGSPYDIAASSCTGTWTDNGDGTINLSYDISSGTLTDTGAAS